MRWTNPWAGRRLSAYLREETGGASLEFVVLVPQLIFIIFVLAEYGVMMARSVMISRGTDIAIRDVRLNNLPVGGTYDPDGPAGPEPAVSDDGLPFKRRVCEGAFLISNCVENLQVEMFPLRDPATGALNTALFSDDLSEVECVDQPASETITPVTSANFTPGGSEQIMFVRVCLVVSPLFPGVPYLSQLPKESLSGGYAIVSQTAFMNEPS